MKRLLLVLLVLGLLTGCKHAEEVRIGEVLLLPDTSYVPIYNKANGVVIDSIRNYWPKDQYPIISIYKVKGDFAKVTTWMPLDDNYPDKAGWVETKDLGTYICSFSDSELIPVMCQPDFNSEISFEIIVSQWSGCHRIIDAYDGWLYIQNKYNPKEFGWLSPDYQCN